MAAYTINVSMTETNANHTHLIDWFCSRPSSLCTLVSRKVKWFGHGGLHHRCVELGVASYRAREGGRTISCGLKTRLTELVVERILWFRSACRCWRRIGGHLSPEFQADLSGLSHHGAVGATNVQLWNFCARDSTKRGTSGGHQMLDILSFSRSNLIRRISRQNF